MSHRQTRYLVVPAIAVLLGAGAASQAMAQTVMMQPGQVTQSTVVVAPMAPPPPQTEIVPAAPVGATVTTFWQQGHWNWNGVSWVWANGAYEQRVTQPVATAAWVPAQWVQQPTGGYAWIEGHWQS
jgi:hypothetical protein